MEYWEIDVEKVNKLNFSNKEVEEFASRWSQLLVNARNSITWSKEPSNIVYEA